MKYFIHIILIFSCVLVASFNPANAGLFGDSNLTKAEKLANIEGMETKVHELIEEAVVADPENPENYFRATKIYYKMGWTSQADLNLRRTLSLGGDKFNEPAAKIYQARGYISIDEKKVGNAKLFFNQAHNLAPELKEADLKDIILYGQDYLQRGQGDKAKDYFLVAQSINPKLGDTISDLYYDACSNMKNPCLSFYRRASEFSEKNNQRIAILLVDLYNLPGHSKENKATLKNEISRYVSRAEYKRIFPPPPPDKKIKQAGTHHIPTNINEITPFWIKIDIGRKMRYGFKSKDYNFLVTYDDGQKVLAAELDKWPAKKIVKCKLTRLSKHPISLIVK